MILDLSHPISAGMLTYPGLEPPALHTVISRSDSARRLGSGVSYEIEALTLLGNTGTCVNSPFQFHADRADIAHLPPERLVNVPIIVIHALEARAVPATRLGDPGRLWGKAVLVHTGWSRHWGTARYLEFDNPFLSPDAVDQLIAANVAVVGIDTLGVDDPNDTLCTARNSLLGADIPIIEHLTSLERLPDEGARLTALPAPISGMASFPVRAVATWPEPGTTG